MKYAQIINDTIIKIYNKLPGSWNNISNLDALTPEELRDLGWSGNEGVKFYPVEEATRPKYDPLYKIHNPEYTIDDINYKVVQTYLTTPVSDEIAWNIIRQQRNNKLYESDWTQLADAPLSDEQKDEYKIYRKALRDITIQNDPFSIVWPVDL